MRYSGCEIACANRAGGCSLRMHLGFWDCACALFLSLFHCIICSAFLFLQFLTFSCPPSITLCLHRYECSSFDTLHLLCFCLCMVIAYSYAKVGVCENGLSALLEDLVYTAPFLTLFLCVELPLQAMAYLYYILICPLDSKWGCTVSSSQHGQLSGL